MSEITRLQVEEALKTYQDPYLETDLVSAGAISDVTISGQSVVINVELGYPAAGHINTLVGELKKSIKGLAAEENITIEVASQITSHAVQQGMKPLKGVKNIIAVASGKGGVGKSTTSVNLALALQKEGARVAILDADIYGPSQPKMLGVSNQQPSSKDGKSIEPVVSHGLQSMSMGFLVDEEAPMIWRGPMVTQALEQLLNDTNWDQVDYLVIDLPPGTGDVQLTLSQKIPVSGAVIVTTPQDISLLDARKALKMFEKVNVPVLGIIENMSTHICSECGHEEPIFGAGGGQLMADQYGVNLLGALPLDIKIREHADGGTPTVAIDENSDIALIYRDVARKITASLSVKAKDYSSVFPKIVIQNS